MRYLLAFLLFNLIASQLIGAFEVNTAYLFDEAKIQDLREAGIPIDPFKWGWGDHYLWRLFSCIVATAAAAFVCGACAVRRGGVTALIGNLPSIAVWVLTLVYALREGDQIVAENAYIAISFIAIPASSIIAYFFGYVGESWQGEFSPGTVLGLRWFHCLWLWVPLLPYATAIIYVVAVFVRFQLSAFSGWGVLSALVGLLLALPIAVLCAGPYWVYKILCGGTMEDSSLLKRGLATVCLVILALPLGLVAQFACYWLANLFV